MEDATKSKTVNLTSAQDTARWRDLRVAITGGTAGLGLALVHTLLDQGAKVAFVARNREGVESLARERPGSRGIIGDVSRKEDIYPIALQVLGALGGLDILINNASSLGPVPLVSLADTSCEDFELALQTNVLGPFRLTKALLGALAASARDGGRPLVINVSSDAAINAYANWGAYGASKAALHHLSRIWDEEIAQEGVHVISWDPGDMDTALHAMAAPGADRSALKSPVAAARELLSKIEELIFMEPAGEGARARELTQ